MIKRLFVIFMMFVLPSCSRSPKSVDNWPYFQSASHEFFKTINPNSTFMQREEFARATWYGSGGNVEIGFTLHGIAVKESGLEIRKHQKNVKQNKDYLGTHNVCYFALFKMMGMPLKSAKEKRKLLDALTDNPYMGTMFSSMWFTNIWRKSGKNIRESVMIWKYGNKQTSTERISSLEYWNDVKWLASDVREMYRRVKAETKTERTE